MIPARGRVLLRRVESGESYPGGKIIIPETMRDALMAQHAEVVAVGEPALCDDDDCSRVHNEHPVGGEWLRYHPTYVFAGNWVVVAKRAGVECGDDTGKTYLANVEDVLAVLQA